MNKTQIEAILGVSINSYQVAFKELEVMGRLDQRKVHQLLALILDELAPIKEEKIKVEETKVEKMPIFNPESKDFKVSIRNEKNNMPEEYIIPAQEIAYFEPKIAEVIKKQFAAYLANNKDVHTDYEDRLKAAMDEISVSV